MEQERFSQLDFSRRPVIDTDLQPLYQLTEKQYQFVINRMSNLVGEVAQRLAQTGNTEVAQIATEQGYEILRDYDDDAAEAIRWCTQPRLTDPSRLGYPRDVTHKLPEQTIDLPIL